MNKNKTYWTMKNGDKIDIDLMSENHLRNTLKMIARNIDKRKTEGVAAFTKSEVDALTKRNHFNDDWMWK